MKRRPELENRDLFKLMVIATWLVIAGWAVACYEYAAYPAMILLIIQTVFVSPLTLILFSRGFERAALHTFVTSTVACIAIDCELISARVGFEYFFMAGAPIAVLLFESRSQRDQVIAVGTVAIGWLATTLLPTPDAAWYLPTGLALETSRELNFAIASGFTVISVFAHLTLAQRHRRTLSSALDRSRAAEAVLLRTFEHMREGVVVEDASGRVVRHNAALAEILGFSSQICGLYLDPSWRVFDEDGRELGPDAWPSRRAAAGRPQTDLTLRILRADGETRWLLVNSVAFGSIDEHAHRLVLTTMLDVTKRKASEDLLYQIVNGTPDWIFIKDRAHRYLTANSSYAAALKLSPSDMIGRTDLELGFPEDLVRGNPERGIRGFWADDDLVFATKRLQTFENDPAEVDGVARTFHTVKTPLFSAGQTEPYAVLGFARDITALKEVERQLFESSKMASLGQMAGGIAHEINNPLAIIDGRSRLLLQQLQTGRLDPAPAAESLNRIIATVERIAKIIKGLKTFARGGEDDPLEPVQLRAVIEDSLAFCAERFRSHGLKIEIEAFADELLLASAAQLSQVMINLLNNAHDAVDDLDERWVRIGVTVDQKSVRLTITDSGRGIPAAIAERLSQPFFTTKPVGRGTGLGLMISRRIVERHGGRLYLDAAASNTCFVVELPRSVAGAAGRAA